MTWFIGGLSMKGRRSPLALRALMRNHKRTALFCLALQKQGWQARAGLIYADSHDIHDLQRVMHDEHYFPSLYAMEAMAGYFNDAQPFQVMRDIHLKAMNEDSCERQ